MTQRPLIVDMYCGSGGAGMGYFLAGFDVIGIDINPQPDYPFKFIQANVFDIFWRIPWHKVSAIHASPPCQLYSVTKTNHRANKHGERRVHSDCLAPTRALLQATELPYVIENVPGAPMIDPLTLCGSMFGLQTKHFELKRHRLFELNWPEPRLPPHTCGRKIAMSLIGHTGHYSINGKARHVTREQGMQLMGMPWITKAGRLTQAIPPAYTSFLGYWLRKQI